MIRYSIGRFLVMLLRLLGVAVLLLLAIEVGFGWLGQGETHVWNIFLERAVFFEADSNEAGPWERVWAGAQESLLPGSIAILSIWVIGYGWGVLGSRIRGNAGLLVLRAPFVVGASFPSFWIVILVATYSYFVWERPGFADEVYVDSGPDLLAWWHAVVVAFPLVLAGSARQIRDVGDVINRNARFVDRKALYLLGYSNEEVFYRQVLRRSRRDLAGLLDRNIPMVLGGLIVLEVAFHTGGLGRVFAEAVSASELTVVFLSGVCLAAFAGVFTWIRECLSFCEKEPIR